MAELFKNPNPGSKEAIALGCLCPVLDNNHGKGAAMGGYWMTANCPLHGIDTVPDKTIDNVVSCEIIEIENGAA